MKQTEQHNSKIPTRTDSARQMLEEVFRYEKIVPILRDLAVRHNLDRSLLVILGEEVGKLILENAPSHIFAARLQERLALSAKQAEELAQDIDKIVVKSHSIPRPTPQQNEKQSPSSSASQKSLVDHLKMYEKRKQELSEKERQREKPQPPQNLPTGGETIYPKTSDSSPRGKTRPEGSDPYREPIE